MATASEETTIVSAQVPVRLRDTLAQRAHEADRTLSAEIRRALAAHAATPVQSGAGVAASSSEEPS